MSTVLSPIPKFQFFTANGDPLVGGHVYSYAAGTSTPLATYTTEAGTTANPNPVILDGRGECTMWLTKGKPYKLRLTDANDVEIWTVDQISDDTIDLPATLAGSGGSALVGFTQGGTGASVMTVQDKLRQFVNVADFGAVGDGVTDDTAAFQRAVSFAQAANSSVMEIRLSSKAYNIVGTIVVNGGPVRFVGEGYLDFNNARPTTRPTKGSWMLHSSPTGPLFQFNGDLGKCSGLTNIAIYEPGHAAPGAGWLPLVRDWVIRNENTQGTLILDRVHFHGVYRGVNTALAVRPSYENITGQFFSRGFAFDEIYDLGKLEGVHAWTYWSEQTAVLLWQQANSVTVSILRVDGLWLDRIFAFAANVAVYVGQGTAGTGKVIDIGGLYADFCGRGLVCEGVGTHVAVANMFHLGQKWGTTTTETVTGACSIHIAGGNNALIQVANLYSTLTETAAVKVEGSYNQLWIASPIFAQYNRSGSATGAIYATATNLCNLGAFPSVGVWGGGASYLVRGAPGGTVTRPTKQVVIGTTVNNPVTAGADTGQTVAFTAEGEANASVAFLARGTGITIVGAPTNRLSFYGGGSGTQDTLTGSRGGNVALANLITYLADRGLLFDGTTA